MSQARIQQIDEILKDLEGLKKRGFENMYALDENIKFFEAMRSPFKYIKWLINEKPKINGSRLLELSDFPLGHGRWESTLQSELLALEKKRFPDVLNIPRSAILKQISKIQDNNKRLVIVGLGSGTFEMERQIIEKLKAQHDQHKIIFIGIDNSSASIEAAKKNLIGIDVQIVDVADINAAILETIKTKYSSRQYIICLLAGNALDLNKYFANKSIDIMFHSRFKHHLSKAAQEQLDKLIEDVSNYAVEHDDLNGWFLLVVAPLLNWNKPVMMNGALFSSFRDPTRGHLLKASNQSRWVVKLSIDGYLRTYNAI